ncbi:MAG: Alkaline phosphatase synthesis transcriptional regulatory protein phoP [uncultured bacterium]|nr:MAG: Alkaline phosphatase synthesis transcriptional regulatory protein phoP [uncultured bacterium]
MTRILVIEDEQVIRELLCDNLEFDGFVPVAATSLAEGEKALKLQQPEMVLLDLNLPDGNGAERLKEWRSAGMNLPVIICTVRDREIDIIKALDAGADDYVTKPFRIRELIARIRAVLRRTGNSSESRPPRIGRLDVDFSARVASCADERVNLTTTEWQMLEYLWNNKNQVLSREQIIDCIWGISELEDSRAVDVHIGRLRRKIEIHAEPETLLTVRGFGYTLKI